MSCQTFPVTDSGTFDLIIVGGGIAGLYTALHAAPLKVAVITAAPFGEGASSAWAQGGIAAALAEEDSIESHLSDTLEAGAGLVRAEAARRIATEAEQDILCLEQLGVSFDRDPQGKRLFSREAAHSHRRILRIGGDQAGKALMQVLTSAVEVAPHVTIVDRASAEEVITKDGGVHGLIYTKEGRFFHLRAGHLLLATGGIGGLYATTTNPAEARGQGLVLAARAGASLTDLEFVQFHPTALAVHRFPAPLLTEALRGEGARLTDRQGASLIPASETRQALAPRDIVARAVFAARQKQGEAFLDCRDIHKGTFNQHFPQVNTACLAAGINPSEDLIPIAPAAHYHMGGVETDLEGRTACAGLWAAGEVACTGVHGANRLASNSLLEALVFSRRAAEAIRQTTRSDLSSRPIETFESLPPAPPRADFTASLRTLMSDKVGVVRNGKALQLGLDQLTNAHERATTRTEKAMALTGGLIASCARWREESRGAHFRTDFPKTDKALCFHQSWRLEERDTILTPLPSSGLTSTPDSLAS